MSDFVFPNDQPVVQLDCIKAFGALTNKEKHYAHYLSRASWYGGLIVLLQTSVESPLIYTLLQKLFRSQTVESLTQLASTKCNFSEDDFQAFLVYASGVLTNMGNYKGFGDLKFIPNVSQEKLDRLICESDACKKDCGAMTNLWNKCKDKMYSLQKHEKQLGFSDTGTTTYFSNNCTAKDSEIVKSFMKEKGMDMYNSRVFKRSVNDSFEYEIRFAAVDTTTNDYSVEFQLGAHEHNGSKFVLTRGDYSKILNHCVGNLKKAKEHAANENEVNMLEQYAVSFATGSLDAHKRGSRFWIKDKGPVVETYIGFIETYRDPAGMRGEFEGFVAMVNKLMSKKFMDLVENGEKFLPLLPWTKEYEKDVFLSPDFTSLDVLTFSGSGIPAGICIPNYEEIRQNEGFKNVSLGNVITASYQDSAPNFLTPDDVVLLSKHRVGSFEVQVGLHELLGHGSGKLFRKESCGKYNFDQKSVVDLDNNEIKSWYEDGETYDSIFSAIGSAYEECRAECVGLYLSTDDDVLRIFGYGGKEAEDIVYINWLSLLHRGLEGLQMYEPDAKKWLQAHSQARYVIMQVLLEAGQGFVSVRQTTGTDGKPDLLLTLDRSKIMTVGKEAIGKFLFKLQVYKSTADIKKASAMFEHYSAVVREGEMPFLAFREIIMARKKPRKMFVQANTFVKNGDVELKTYEASHTGLIQSWVERFPETDLDNILEEACKLDEGCFL